MRGTDIQQGGLFSYVSLEERIPADHPLRAVRALLDEALAMLDRLPKRTTRHVGYRISQRIRKRIEEGFGWGTDGRPLRKMKLTGKAQVGLMATLIVGCYALLRLANLRVCRIQQIRVLDLMKHDPTIKMTPAMATKLLALSKNK
jgi:hypothetical protein